MPQPKPRPKPTTRLRLLDFQVKAPSPMKALVITRLGGPEVLEIQQVATPHPTPDQVLVIGTLANGAVFTIQIEGGKRNNSGLQIDWDGRRS